MVARPEWEIVVLVLVSMARYLVVEIARTWLRNEEEVEEAMTALSNLGTELGKS
jgi:hypothetical protein